MINFKPMLAYTITDTAVIEYPVYASIKLDGIRVIILDGVVYSRSMKPIRSKAVQKLFGKEEYNGLDGEIIYGPWNAVDVFNKTTQAVMSIELKEGFSKEKLHLWVFDNTLLKKPYIVRKVFAEGSAIKSNVHFLGQNLMCSEEELLGFEKYALEDGFEGVMVRAISAPYKQGRSTQKEGYIGKLKRFSDDEAVITGFEEKMTNTNEAYTNEVGRSQRSSSQEGMVGAGTLGAFICTCKGVTFTIGSGLTDSERDEVWQNRDKYINKYVKFKYFAVGVLVAPRFPVFLGWRDVDDTSN